KKRFGVSSECIPIKESDGKRASATTAAAAASTAASSDEFRSQGARVAAHKPAESAAHPRQADLEHSARRLLQVARARQSEVHSKSSGLTWTRSATLQLNCHFFRFVSIKN